MLVFLDLEIFSVDVKFVFFCSYLFWKFKGIIDLFFFCIFVAWVFFDKKEVEI